MAYTSDLRIKNILKDIHLEIIEEIRFLGINKFPELRIFDESNEDSYDFKDGGLTFSDPDNNHKYGSNDAAWVFEKKPLVVVEGTFGTERGQFGDGQLNRFSHSLGAARNGSIGVTFIPMEGESYSKRGAIPSKIDSSIRFKYARIHKGFVKGAINVSKTEEGFFLIIDAYNPTQLKSLVVETFKKSLKIDNNREVLIEEIISKMKNLTLDFKYGDRSKGLIKSLWNSNKHVVSNFSRAYTHNFASLTDSSKRDGHGLFGKCLLESYISGSEEYYAIFLRLAKNDVEKLKLRKQKEFTFISNSDHINIVCFDDLIFKNKSQQLHLEKIRTTNLFQNREDAFLKEIQDSINLGEIYLKQS